MRKESVALVLAGPAGILFAWAIFGGGRGLDPFTLLLIVIALASGSLGVYLRGERSTRGGDAGKILSKKYRARHAVDKFKMDAACKILDGCAASLLEQQVKTRILDEFIVDVDVDTEGKVVTVTYDEGKEFFRKEDGNWHRIEMG